MIGCFQISKNVKWNDLQNKTFRARCFFKHVVRSMGEDQEIIDRPIDEGWGESHKILPRYLHDIHNHFVPNTVVAPETDTML